MAHSIHTPQAPEQLALLSPGELPAQFRLDQRTRERGLAHIAAIKAQLAAKAVDQPQSPGPAHLQPSAQPQPAQPQPAQPQRRLRPSRRAA
ncbi:MAG: hypothetical protein Q7V88_05720 [Actinomycetota bacterium]|nr:hypothetical protein [Actinomycetota bacterium]